MDPRGALTVLGLTRPTSADAVRRAYLKGVRVRSPERDPDGFRELRAAYELLEGAPPAWLAAHGPGPAAPSPPHAPDAPAVALPEAPPTDATPALQAPPGDATPPLQASRGATSSFEAVPAVPPLVAAIKARDAATAVSILLEVLEGRPTERARGFVPSQVLEVAIGLLTRGDFANASRLLQKFDAWTSALGVGVKEIGVQWVARWTLLRELTSLHGQIDDDTLRVLVEAVRTSDFRSAIAPLERAQEKNPAFEERLKRLAPTLYRTIWPRVVPHDATLKKLRKRGGWRGIGAGFGILYAAVRLLLAMASDPGSHTSRPLLDPPDGPAASAAPNADPVSNEQRLALLASGIDGSIASGACQDVRDAWPLYARGARGEGAVSGLSYDVRRANALKMCGELATVLPEKP
ncbi:MAG TPA: J domain-containing protein [Polyangiaceae bacterium]|nr:J domain-containing protein [Polyangiaceae bacterium]